jgi:glucokinase
VAFEVQDGGCYTPAAFWPAEEKVSMTTTIGVDIGGTLLRAARFDHDMKMLERVESESNAQMGADAVIGRLVALVQQVLPEDPDDLGGVGIGVPGPLDLEQGVVIATPNLPWENVPLADLVRQAVGGTVHLGNDADVAGLAEHRLGAGKGTRHMIYMTISTGIGGGIINDGKLVTGRGMGGEVGHIMINPKGPQCGCGQYGHLEAIASGTGIAHITREKLAAGAKSGILDYAEGDIDKVTSSTVGLAALDGDALAVELIQEAGRVIGIGMATLMHLFNPEMFVLGGGVTKTGDLLFDAIRQSARDHVMNPRFAENTSIVPAALGGDVGLMGAALLVEMHQRV